MKSDESKDILSEYAESARKIRASQRFRNDTLAKIRLQTADAGIAKNASISNDFDDIKPRDGMQNQTPITKTSYLRRFVSVAAAVVIVCGTAVILYNKAAAEYADSSRSNAETAFTGNESQVSSLISRYQACNEDVSEIYSMAETQFAQVTRLMNPPQETVTAEALENLWTTFLARRKSFDEVMQRQSEIKEKLCFCGDVVICDVQQTSADTLLVTMINGTDSDITVSGILSLINADTKIPIDIDSNIFLETNPQLPANSSSAFPINDVKENLVSGTTYQFSLNNFKYHANTENSGKRTLTFTYNQPSAVLRALFSDDTDYTYTLNCNSNEKRPKYADYDAYVQSHDTIGGFFEDYVPAYTFESNLWSFSPQQNGIDEITRKIWIFDDNDAFFAECLNGTFSLIPAAK